ncbi:hypothetical protein PM082_011746 [Marasmius tenuissimus]|nr:hypothetical protein PM082_011746 [Marasmius tenuissimus]
MRSVVGRWFLKDVMDPNASLEHQFYDLDITQAWNWERALRSLFNNLAGMASVPNVVIIDGLNEWSDPDKETPFHILSVILSTIQHVPHFPLRFLICSRPEAWNKGILVTQSLLRRLTKKIDIESFLEQDIMLYYSYHFRERVVTNPKYSQVRLKSPWPSQKDLEMLVKRTRPSIYASIVIRFLGSPHPTVNQGALERIAGDPSFDSNYRALDHLYSVILSFSPDCHLSLHVLAAILIIPDHLEPTPEHIEILLRLPKGQVALTLRVLDSVLDTGDWEDEINLYHISLRDYLVDQNRSRQFHIDIPAHTQDIARQWLGNLTTSQVRTRRFEMSLLPRASLIHICSPDQLYRKGTRSFYVGWIKGCCEMIPELTEDLLDNLWNVDLASAYPAHGRPGWESMFQSLVPWVMKCHPLNPELAERLVHKFMKCPDCFHLEWPLGTSPRDDAGHWVVQRAAGCEWTTRLDGLRPDRDQLPRLTDCRCDLSEGDVSRDPGHLAYQDACIRLIEAFYSLFQELAQSVARDDETIDELSGIFLNMVRSSLLKSCPLHTSLVRLCRKFFTLAKGCLVMRIDSSDREKGKKNVLEWIGTFPDEFVAKGEALKSQLLALPWERWEQNWEHWIGQEED